MWWILMACSSSDMKMATESDEIADSGFVYDTGMMNDDACKMNNDVGMMNSDACMMNDDVCMMNYDACM